MTYQEFIQSILDARGRFIEKDENVIKERHHILPKSMGEDNKQSNLIDLVGTEHYEAHKLLALENPECKEAQQAWWCMCHTQDANGREYEVSAEDWAEARLRNRSAISGENSPWYGRHHTDETKEKLRKSHIGKKMSAEARLKMSKSRKGRTNSPEAIEKVRQKLKGKPFTEEHKQALRDNHADYMGEKHPRYGTHCTDETKEKIGKANGHKVYCDGMIFYSAPACARCYDVNPNTLKNWLYGKNKTPDIWEERGLRFLDD